MDFNHDDRRTPAAAELGQLTTDKRLWTGTKLLVWGGNANVPGGATNTGGAYASVADTWTPISTTGAPGARYKQGSVWTGSRILVWGGGQGVTGRLHTGVRLYFDAVDRDAKFGGSFD